VLRGLVPAPIRRAASDTLGSASFVEQLAGRTAVEQRRLLRDLVFGRTAGRTRPAAGRPARRRPRIHGSGHDVAHGRGAAQRLSAEIGIRSRPPWLRPQHAERARRLLSSELGAGSGRAEPAVLRTSWTGSRRRSRPRNSTRTPGVRWSSGCHPASGKLEGVVAESGDDVEVGRGERRRMLRSSTGKWVSTELRRPGSGSETERQSGMTDTETSCGTTSRWSPQTCGSPSPVEGDRGAGPGADRHRRMACRYPVGSPPPSGLWQAVARARMICEFPPTAAGTSEALYDPTRVSSGPLRPARRVHRGRGGVRRGLFRYLGREALAMIRSSGAARSRWEASERPGSDPSGLRGTDTAPSSAGLMPARHDIEWPPEAEGTGSPAPRSASFRPARVLPRPRRSRDSRSYPVSSSLVALHLAPRPAKTGCSLVLAGGVGDQHPIRVVELSGSVGSPRTAAARRTRTPRREPAGRGAGRTCAGAVVDARRQGRRILAVVRGSGGQPGRRRQRIDRANGRRSSG